MMKMKNEGNVVCVAVAAPEAEEELAGEEEGAEE